MIRLKNVSKFYYQKGVVSSGFSKVSLEFNMGEFVAITGESGSGKSTLLNVISGLDTYEEGEMYINGNETSHFTESDFEEYRKKYIGNIFQSFNLINSYTVLQNVELVLTLSGVKKREAKARALDLIEKVGLTEYKNAKASKLSGGQKQRVAIARALAKDTPIIIADEPTGNLDSESAKEVFKILKEVSRDKLVIIVTHNYEQVEPYVTRKIKMHDGKVIEDYKVSESNITNSYEEHIEEKKMRFFDKIRIGFRNVFNIVPKFLLLLLVFLFVSVALISEYASMREATYQQGILGYNWYFNNTSENRIIIKKVKDDVALPFKKKDFKKINKLDNIDYIEKQDLLCDTTIGLDSNDQEVYLYGSCSSIKNYKGPEELTCGKMPENPNEILVVTTSENWYFWDELETYLEKDYRRYSDIKGGYIDGYKISGIVYLDEKDNSLLKNGEMVFYISDEVLSDLLFETNMSYSTVTSTFMGNTYEDDYSMWHIVTSDNVELGTCVMSNDHNYLYENVYSVKGKVLTLNVTNPYYEKSIDLVCAKTYYQREMKDYYTIEEGDSYDWYYGYIFVNPEDYKALFDEPSYQASVFVKDGHFIDETITSLKDLGYTVLAMKDTLYIDESAAILQLVSNMMTVLAAVLLLVISYFVIRIILKSRNVYYSTIRMIGASMKISRSLLIIELLVDATISYIITLGLIYLGNMYYPDMSLINSITTYMDIKSYVIVYLIVFVISLIISLRYSNRLFKKSTIKTIKEEV